MAYTVCDPEIRLKKKGNSPHLANTYITLNIIYVLLFVLHRIVVYEIYCFQKQSSMLVLVELLDVYELSILPSLCLIPCNCCIAEEIWTFLKLLKYDVRYE